MTKKEQIIGVVGGMGSFATLHFFERILLAYPAEKEWDRPRVIIDNRCTMPSRVRALLYKERYEELVHDLAASVTMLMKEGCTDIILACNTSHCFLKEIERIVPECRGLIINIIDMCCKEMNLNHVKHAYLMATEGTIDTRIYEEIASDYGIEFCIPTVEEQVELRFFIEAVKQNRYSEEVYERFYKFWSGISAANVVLGCTELPILYEKAKMYCPEDCKEKIVVDPLECTIKELKRRALIYEERGCK